MRIGSIAVLAVILAGCATGTSRQPYETSAGFPESVPDFVGPVDSGTEQDPSDAETALLRGEAEPGARATLALLAASREQRIAGNLAGAVATVERALGIAPDDPALWVELAEIRMAEGNPVLAAEMARKALTLTGENTSLAARAQRIINR